MKLPFACLAALAPICLEASGGSLPGPTGLLTIPTADVLAEGSIAAGYNEYGQLGDRDSVPNTLFAIGFAPWLEAGGRITQYGGFEDGADLSFNAKLRLWKFDGGPGIAVGGTDIGGEARYFRSRYAVATLPWRTLSLTVGHRWSRDLTEGTLAGLEWQPWPVIGAYAEYDTNDVNPGLRLQSPALWQGLRVSAQAGYLTAAEAYRGGIELSLPLGKVRRAAKSPAQAPPPAASAPRLRQSLEALGFESVRSGSRPDGTLVVSLENRRYNHSSADGVGLALGAIATQSAPEVQRIELNLASYGVPQLAATTSASAWREYLSDGSAAPGLLEVRYSDGSDDDIRWDNPPAALRAAELYVEPVLRTFVATEYGVLDAGAGVRSRVVAPLMRGLTAQLGLQAPVARTDDFRDGRNFADFAPEAGLDLAVAQYAHKPSAGWTSLWSVGAMQVFTTDLSMLGTEQSWTSARGRHRLHAKLMSLDSGAVRHTVALGSYTWHDPARRYSASVTGGRFYLDDRGVRLDLNRTFDDSIAGLFLKVEGEDNMAGGFQLSVPLTPRRDALPRTLQVKGPRRWGHSLQTTLNLADGSNALKPLLLYEPMLDLDLRRDFHDSGRLGPEYLESQLPRMREAWELWGG